MSLIIIGFFVVIVLSSLDSKKHLIFPFLFLLNLSEYLYHILTLAVSNSCLIALKLSSIRMSINSAVYLFLFLISYSLNAWGFTCIVCSSAIIIHVSFNSLAVVRRAKYPSRSSCHNNTKPSCKSSLKYLE